MKIVHFWDMAGVSCILAKWQRKAGHSSCAVSKTKVHDPFGFMKFYGEHGVNSNFDALLYTKALMLASNADIVHIHGIPEAVVKFRMLGKKTVLHCHGTELVTNPKRISSAGADRIIVSTKNLLDYCPEATCVPNPIDTEHFASNGNKGTGWLTFKIRYLDMGVVENLTKDLYVTFRDRDTEPIDYAQMPEFLNRFEGYVDIKFDKNYGHLVHVHSKAALEALACGLKVRRWDGQTITGLPEENKPESVTQKLEQIYNEVLK